MKKKKILLPPKVIGFLPAELMDKKLTLADLTKWAIERGITLRVSFEPIKKKKLKKP